MEWSARDEAGRPVHPIQPAAVADRPAVQPPARNGSSSCLRARSNASLSHLRLIHRRHHRRPHRRRRAIRSEPTEVVPLRRPPSRPAPRPEPDVAAELADGAVRAVGAGVPALAVLAGDRHHRALDAADRPGLAGAGAQRQRGSGRRSGGPAVPAGAPVRPGRGRDRGPLSEAHPADHHPVHGGRAGRHPRRAGADRHRPGLARLPGRAAARHGHRGGQPDPPGVRCRAGRRRTHRERGQPELLGLPVRRAGRPGPHRRTDRRRRAGLVLPDQRARLRRCCDHGRGDPADQGTLRGRSATRSRTRASSGPAWPTSGTPPRSPGRSSWSAPSASWG